MHIVCKHALKSFMRDCLDTFLRIEYIAQMVCWKLPKLNIILFHACIVLITCVFIIITMADRKSVV